MITRIYITSKIACGKTVIPKCDAPRKAFGFTIAEMLIVAALIALLAAAGGGIYVGTYRHSLVKKSARDFLLTARYARIVAVERQRPCSLEIDETNGRFWLRVDVPNEQSEETEKVIVRDFYTRPVEFGGDVKFESVQVSSGDSEQTFMPERQREIIFQPDGTAQAAVIQIGDGENCYSVSISAATGKAKVCFGAADKVEVTTIDLDGQ